MLGEGGQLNLAEPVFLAGLPVSRARHAMIMIHGRGSTADDILSLAAHLDNPDFAYLAPQAAGNTWYPRPFTAPISENEPYLSASLSLLNSIVAHLSEAGIAPERLIILGFSQGACLALEYAARHARRYGGLIGLSGGLIGPEGMKRNDEGSLAGTTVFLGCSDVDPHIPKHRVQQTADVLTGLGGAVTTRLYAHMGHTINEDERHAIRGMMSALAGE